MTTATATTEARASTGVPQTGRDAVDGAVDAELQALHPFLGAAGGLTECAIRRSCVGGRGSAGPHHRAKYLQMVMLGRCGLGIG